MPLDIFKNPFKKLGSSAGQQQTYDIGVSANRSSGRHMPLQAVQQMFKMGTNINPMIGPDPIFRPLTAFSQFIEPRHSFAEMQYAYENDAEISFGLDFITAISVGMGHHFTAGHTSSNLVDYISQFATEINLDDLATYAGREALGFGNSVWTYKDISAKEKTFDIVEPMPLTSLKRIWWNGPSVDSTVGYYEFRGARIVRMLPGEVIHFRWRNVNAWPFGLGLIAPIISRPLYTFTRNGIDETRRRMSLFDIKSSTMDTAHKIMKRYVPRNVYNAVAAQTQQLSEMQGKLDDLEDEQDIVLSGQTEITELGRQTRSIDVESFDSLYKNEMIKALATPVSRLYEKGSLTEASANVAKETTLMHLSGFQRSMKRMIERLMIKPWYMANPKYDANGVVIPWVEAKAELHWGMAEKPKMDAQQFVELLKAKPTAFSDEEVRNYASTGGVELMPDTWVKVDPQAQLMQQQAGMMQKQDMNKQLVEGKAKLINNLNAVTSELQRRMKPRA